MVLECDGGGSACATARESLEREGVEPAPSSSKRAIRILVGPWDRLRQDPAARLLEVGPAESGIYASFKSIVRRSGDGDRTETSSTPGYALIALDENGDPRQLFGGAAGLVAATSRYGGPPVWLITGGTAAAVREAAEALDEEHLRDHYAVAVEDGEVTSLPEPGR